MYGYKWSKNNGIFTLGVSAPIEKEIRPVFKEELDFFGMDEVWDYPDTDAPILWAEGIRRYVLDGVPVADAKGGGFYTKPKIKTLSDERLKLAAIDVKNLWAVNEELMNGLVQRSIAFIRETYNKYSEKGYKFVVAFSGGKDSLVLLDLVQRALAPDQFVVVFGDTGMELSDTYKTIEKAKEVYPNLDFRTAKSPLSADQSWKLFGPPGRRLRWCCCVHKSVPTLLLLRKITNSPNIRAVVFDGVRAEESAQRSTYLELGEGNKHSTQVNCSPILKWNTAELYLYLLHRNILINQVYRNGLFRCGCAVCPMSSNWWDGIANILYKDDLKFFLNEVEDYARREKPEKEIVKYIEDGGWKGRFGGRGVVGGGNRTNEVITDNALRISIANPTQSWMEIAPILGAIVERKDDSGQQSIRNQLVNFKVTTEEGRMNVEYSPYNKLDRVAVSWIRGLANKAGYCVGCKACMVECPTAAFQVSDAGKISINARKCIHCGKCITELPSACWAAKSLRTTTGDGIMDLKGINRYQHFGLSGDWLAQFLDMKNDFWAKADLGNRQFDSFRVWLREATLIDNNARGATNGQMTEIGQELSKVDDKYNPFVWAVVWTHLVYNSVLMRWYAFFVPAGEPLEKGDYMQMLGDSLAEATRSNAVLSLTSTMSNSPIGSALEQGLPLGAGKVKRYVRQGWSTPDPWAILYSLYLYAEKIGNHYDFTLRELLTIGREKKTDLPAVDPITIFALNPDNVKELFRELSAQFPQYIKTSFVAGLDNIQLVPTIKSIDIVKAAVKEA